MHVYVIVYHKPGVIGCFLRTKMRFTEQHLKEQEKYVKHLLSTSMDPDLVRQEKLVERQLKRRQVKLTSFCFVVSITHNYC